MLKPLHTALIIVLLFAVSIYIRFQSELVSDAAWFLYVADGLLHGKKLYVDFMEVNPPLGMWLTVPVQALAQTLHTPAIATMMAVYFALTALSLALCYRYLQAPFKNIFIIALAAALLFLPARDFAEREHLAILWLLPWLFLRGAQNPHASILEKILIGLMVGAAICLKPQSIAAPILVEGVLFWRHRHALRILAAENLAAIFFAAAYGLAILTLTPEFLNEMLHLGVTAYVPYNGEGLIGILYMGRWAMLFIALAISIRVALQKAAIDTTLVDILLAAAIGFAFSYFVQAKGFFYQSMPANILGFAACAAGATQLRAKPVFAMLTALLGVGFLYNEKQSYIDLDYAFQPAIESEAPYAKSIFIATSRIDLGFPLVVKHNYIWASRLPTQWLVPYVAAHAAAPEDPIIAKARDWTVTDLATRKPEIVFVDTATNQEQEPGGIFDYQKFWNADPRFAAIWQNYEFRKTFHGFDVFALKPQN